MALIELVDFNTVYGVEAKAEKKTTRRRGSSKAKKAAPAAEEVVAEEKVEEVTPEVAESNEEGTEEAK